MNHSDTPNASLILTGEHAGGSIALRDIKKGEELREDYGNYQWPKWFKKHLDAYKVPTSFFVPKNEK